MRGSTVYGSSRIAEKLQIFKKSFKDRPTHYLLKQKLKNTTLIKKCIRGVQIQGTPIRNPVYSLKEITDWSGYSLYVLAIVASVPFWW